MIPNECSEPKVTGIQLDPPCMKGELAPVTEIAPFFDKVINSVCRPSLGQAVSQAPVLLCSGFLYFLLKTPLVPGVDAGSVGKPHAERTLT